MKNAFLRYRFALHFLLLFLLGFTFILNDRVRAVDTEQAGAARVWQMTGPFGGDVLSLAIDPQNSDVILIGTQDGQLFRSTDGGRTWKRIKPGLGASGYALTVILFDRTHPDVIYIGTQQIRDADHDAIGGGVWISEDHGNNWRELTSLRGRSVRGMVQSSGDANVFAVAARDGIYRTLDRGKSWRRITPENDPELRGFHSVAIDPRDSGTIYAGTWHLPWKTTDGGETWKRAASKEAGMIDDSDIFAIHLDKNDPDTVLMSACSGIYRSTNGSQKWMKIQGIPSTSRRTHVIFQHPTKPELLFAGTTEGLWRSTDRGKPETWSRVTPLRLVINAVAVHPERPDRVFLGTDDYGVLMSTDGGESYEPSNAGFISRQVRTVVADARQRGRIYAGVIFDGPNGGLFVSEDAGVTWKQSMRGMGVRDVYSIYQPKDSPDVLYAGTNYGVYRSEDRGRNWIRVKKDEPLDPSKLAPETPSNQGESALSVPSEFRQQGITSWSPQLVVQKRTKPSSKTPVTKKPAAAPAKKPARPQPEPVPEEPPEKRLINLDRQVFHLAPLVRSSSSDVPVLLAATWDGLYFTEDEKAGWKQIKVANADGSVLTTAAINSLATHPRVAGLICIGTEEGLFVSRNGGGSFVQLDIGSESKRIKSVALDPRNASTMFVGTGNGFFRSLDGGKTWEQRGGGMPLVIAISAIEVNPLNPEEVYAGDHIFGGFYFSRDRGKTWENLDTTVLPSRRILSLSADPFDRNRLYAGSVSGGVYVMSREAERETRK
jgi:photosystem II stability/assembly factor-like uncharacterized protein